MDLNEKQGRKIDGVMRHVAEYMELRFAHACRINPELKRVKTDLTWHELASTRQTLGGLRSYGPDRYVIVDILTSFDEKKKGALFSQSDNQSLFPEIVSEAATEQQTAMDIPGVRSVGDFYKALIPTLGETALLVQTWVWWDLPDAFDLYVMDLQADRIAALRKSEMNPQLNQFYRAEMDKGAEDHSELTMDAVLQFELERTKNLAKAFELRRAEEPGFQKIIRRDALDDEDFGNHVQNLAQRLRVIEQARVNQSLDQPLLDHYGRIFNCEPAEVTCERVVKFEEENAATLRAGLQSMLDSDQSLGPPYNFKESQMDLVREKMSRAEAALNAAPAGT